MNDTRTRRWGKGLHNHSPPQIVKNQFGPVASVWFYSLLGNFLERRQDVALWGGEIGATLLSSLFYTLSSIVRCTGPNTPGVDILAKDLFDLVWPFHNAEVSIVRASVLFAVGSAIGLLRKEMVLSLMFDSSSDCLLRNLQAIADCDPDQECREAAKGLQQVMASSLMAPDQIAAFV